MMANQPTSFRLPFTLPEDVHPAVKDALRLTYQGVVDLNQAIRALVPKVNANTTAIQATTGVAVVASSGSSTPTVSSTHAEPLTDGNSNFIFAAGDILVVIGVAD